MPSATPWTRLRTALLSSVPAALVCGALCGACGEEKTLSSRLSVWRVWNAASDALREGRAGDVLEHFTDHGREQLAAHCLLEGLQAWNRLPVAEAHAELSRLLDVELPDPCPGDEAARVGVLEMHGLDAARLTRLMNDILPTGFAEGVPLTEETLKKSLEAIRSALAELPDRDRFLHDYLPLAELSVLRDGSYKDVEHHGDTATMVISWSSYVSPDVEELISGFLPREGPLEVEMVRIDGQWKIDSLPGG